MTYVGVLCNVDVSADPREQLSPSVVNRAYILDELLSPADIRVFLYCPKDVTAGGEVPGFVLGQDAPAALRQPVPRVNANCSYSTRRLLRQGMRYQPFKKWMQERKNDVYVPYEFSELVSNKLKASDMVRAWNPAVHPLTEEFDGSREQLESYLGRSGVVFLKPRAGHKGNRIFVLRRQARGHALNYYDSGQIRCFTGVSLDTIVALVDAATGRDRYIVQEGIESLRCQDAVFDVRVVMVHDGQSWQSIFETRLAPRGSDLSNVYQGGSIQVPRDVLESAVGESESRAIEERLHAISHGLAKHFESDFPDALPEIGFDFVIDHERRPHVVEVNAKPGIAGIASERKLFDWTEEERALHEMWTYPHTRRLASFLRRKVEVPIQKAGDDAA